MSDDDTFVSVGTLRQVFNEALDSLQEQLGTEVNVDKEYFWSIPPELQYDTYTPPTEEQHTLGQLSEVWDNLARMHARGEGSPTYSLVWIGQLLQALGHRAP